MKYFNLYLLVVLHLICLSGCGNANENTHIKSTPETTQKESVSNFQMEYKKADSFFDMYEAAYKMKEKNEYTEAITLLEKSYKVADNRSTQTMALQLLAQVHEANGDYHLAANYYEGASRTTMSDGQVQEFANKAKELRQKANLN